MAIVIQLWVIFLVVAVLIPKYFFDHIYLLVRA